MPVKPFTARAGPLRPYSLREDFGDGVLQARDDATTHLHYDPHDSPHAGRVLAAQYRPDWLPIEDGTRIYEGHLEHDYARDGHSSFATTSRQRIGEWTVDMAWPERQSVAGDAVEMDVRAQHPRPDHGGPRVALRVTAGGEANLYHQAPDGEETVLVDGGWPDTTDSGGYTFRVQRTAAGRYRLLVNGISQGTTPADAPAPRPQALGLRFVADAGTDSRVEVSRLEVR